MAYLVVEPSVHPSGERYCWLDESEPWSMRPAEAPAWLARVNGSQHEPGHQDAAGIPEGKRNAHLTSLAGSMRRRGMTAEAIAAALLAENAARCRPPLPDDDVRRIAASVGRYEPAKDAADEGLRVEHLPVGWHLACPASRPFVLHPYGPRRAVSGLLGAGTASKTLLVCEWAAAIATGTHWRQHPVQQGDVCILTWEDETADYHAKLHSLLNYARPELLPHADCIRDRLHIIPMHGSPYRLVAPDDRGRPGPTMLPHRVVDLIRSEFPATVQVFIETVSRANGADESNEAMAMMVAAGETIAHALDCGVTAVHHVSKLAAVNGIVDAHAGRGGSALADNSRASTVLALVSADMPQSLWPVGFTAADFAEREIVLIENARSSYARKAPRMHLERVYPEHGAPYLRALRTPAQGDPDAPRRDPAAEKLLGWMQDEKRAGQWLSRDAIVTRFDEYGLTARRAATALARMVETGAVEAVTGKQYGDKGREVTRYRLKPGRQTNET